MHLAVQCTVYCGVKIKFYAMFANDKLTVSNKVNEEISGLT